VYESSNFTAPPGFEACEVVVSGSLCCAADVVVVVSVSDEDELGSSAFDDSASLLVSAALDEELEVAPAVEDSSSEQPANIAVVIPSATISARIFFIGVYPSLKIFYSQNCRFPTYISLSYLRKTVNNSFKQIKTPKKQAFVCFNNKMCSK
jgi:hypothetical protein